jgi:hypothetical protein
MEYTPTKILIGRKFSFRHVLLQCGSLNLAAKQHQKWKCRIYSTRWSLGHSLRTPGWETLFYTLVVGSLFYDAFYVTRLYSVDNRMIGEWWWIGKDLVGSGRDLIVRYYPGIRLEGLRKTKCCIESVVTQESVIVYSYWNWHHFI